MDDRLSRIDLARLYPPFLERVQRGLAALAAQGERFVATSGYRSLEQQDALYALGRSRPGRIVTKAPAGYSAHQYGVGIDLCRDGDVAKPGLQPDYIVAHYEPLAVAMEGAGLEAGLRWTSISDAPHIQLPLKHHGLTWPLLLGVYRRSGLSGVWRQLDQVDWGA